LVVALGACFESGPLEYRLTGGPSIPTGDGDVGADPDALDEVFSDSATAELDGAPDESGDGSVPDGVGDTTISGDASDVNDTPDATEASDVSDGTGSSEVGGDALDTSDAMEVIDTSDADADPVRACLVDGDCQGLPATDLCAGPLRCVDYGCRTDPASRVLCSGSGPCLDVSCNPATGHCDEIETCSCEAPRTLQCGVAASWSTNDQGSQDNVDAYACGPARAGNRRRLFDLPVSGRVRVTTSGDIAGAHVLEGDVCDGVSGCVAGGKGAFYFNAQAGKRYTLATEDGAPNQFVSVRADCDITSETACNDGLDDDGDGASDCAERECNGIAGCVLPPENEVGLCGDDRDDDGDGLTDCDDADCSDAADCLEACETQTTSVYCNLQQGMTNGGGKARATHYACDPVPQTAKEIVIRIDAGYTGQVRIGFSASEGLTLHLLKETGRGCTPRDCVGMSTGDMFINLVEGDVYYLAIDGPGAVVGDFNFQIDCEP